MSVSNEEIEQTYIKDGEESASKPQLSEVLLDFTQKTLNILRCAHKQRGRLCWPKFQEGFMKHASCLTPKNPNALVLVTGNVHASLVDETGSINFTFIYDIYLHEEKGSAFGDLEIFEVKWEVQHRYSLILPRFVEALLGSEEDDTVQSEARSVDDLQLTRQNSMDSNASFASGSDQIPPLTRQNTIDSVGSFASNGSFDPSNTNIYTLENTNGPNDQKKQ
jgi:hypothetical protein